MSIFLYTKSALKTPLVHGPAPAVLVLKTREFTVSCCTGQICGEGFCRGTFDGGGMTYAGESYGEEN